MSHKEYALIVAGGKGTRFGSPIPKQFAELNGKPVLLHTLEAFHRYSRQINIVLVLPEEELMTWQDIAKRYHFKRSVTLQTGGPTRFNSVKQGLDKIPEDGFVAIHDGVRPLISPEIISTSFKLAKVHGCAVAAVHLRESIRAITDVPPKDSFPYSKTRALERSLYKIIQTPQTFNAAVIKKAYSVHIDESTTDDAGVAEQAGQSIFLFEGSFENIKITTPDDLLIASALQSRRSGL